MQFFTMARIYRNPDDAISLRDVWTIADVELNDAAEVACKCLPDASRAISPGSAGTGT